MPRQVKCQDTGYFTTKDKAYKAPNNRYYSSQAAYEKIHENGVWRRKCIEALSIIVYGDTKTFIPTMAMKLMDKYPSYHALHITILEQEEQIKKSVAQKTFTSDYGRFKYIFAIIDNHYTENHIIADAKTNENTLDITAEGVENAGKKGGNSHSVADLLGDL